jgi:hypothetical protein
MREDLQVRLAHTSGGLLARSLHRLRYLVRTQRTRFSLPGATHA